MPSARDPLAVAGRLALEYVKRLRDKATIELKLPAE